MSVNLRENPLADHPLWHLFRLRSLHLLRLHVKPRNAFQVEDGYDLLMKFWRFNDVFKTWAEYYFHLRYKFYLDYIQINIFLIIIAQYLACVKITPI